MWPPWHGTWHENGAIFLSGQDCGETWEETRAVLGKIKFLQIRKKGQEIWGNISNEEEKQKNIKKSTNEKKSAHEICIIALLLKIPDVTAKSGLVLLWIFLFLKQFFEKVDRRRKARMVELSENVSCWWENQTKPHFTIFPILHQDRDWPWTNQWPVDRWLACGETKRGEREIRIRDG